MLENDSVSPKISNLHLFLETCQGEQVYQAWSDVASEVFYASENGTEDDRAVEAWMEDQSAGVPTPPALSSLNNMVQSLPRPGKPDVQ